MAGYFRNFKLLSLVVRDELMISVIFMEFEGRVSSVEDIVLRPCKHNISIRKVARVGVLIVIGE